MKSAIPAPAMLKVSYEIQQFDEKIRLDKGPRFLLAGLVAQINACGFCVDISRAVAMREHIDVNKFNALSECRTSPFFSDRARVALAYAEATGNTEPLILCLLLGAELGAVQLKR